MDDFIKEPDRMDFVDSDHILNYLQSTMDEACESSLMSSDTNMVVNLPSDGRLSSTEGLLDNLIKSVCEGIDESTLIDKGDLNMSGLADNGSSSLDSDIITLSVQPDDVIGKSCPVKNVKNAVKKVSKKEKVMLISPGAVIPNNDKRKRSIGTIESTDTKKVKKAKSVSVSNQDNKTEITCPSGKDDDDDIIVIDEKSMKDDCEIIDEEKDPLALGDDAESIWQPSKVSSSGTSASTSKNPLDHAYQITDNMKQGLSKLVFPSKASFSRNAVQKKKVPPLRPISNTRITIGEALEKAQDAQKSISEEKAKANAATVAAAGSKNQGSPQDQTAVCKTAMKIGSNEPEELRYALVFFREELKLTDSTFDLGKLCSDGSSPGPSLENNQGKDERTSYINLATPSPADSPVSIEDHDEVPKVTDKGAGKGKSRSKPTARCKLTAKMWDLLKFTFDHEHFPSSVHMARLAKMMGVTWSQVRNWFTNRRVENKKNCVFPRDKWLDYCPYCMVTLETETEQKGHLFAAHHIKRVLGAEYVGHGEVEAPRWKHAPLGVTSVNKSSSQSHALSAMDRRSEEEENAESVTNKLGKRWKKSFLSGNESENGGKRVKTGKGFVSDYNAERPIKDEVKDEFYFEPSCLGESSVAVKSEGDDNLQRLVNKIEGDNSEPLTRLNTVVGRSALASGTIINKFVNSSQEGRDAHSKSARQSYVRDKVKNIGSEWPEPKNRYSPIEPSLNIGKSLRIRQKQAQSFIEDSLLGYRCPSCLKIFQTEWQMIKHSLIHLMYMCDICERNFTSEHGLKLHLHDHLTSAYEEEKYYCHFSCKTCHSLKCECYEPPNFGPRDIPKTYARPQKARRSKKTFTTKPYSGPNDHLRVTFGGYQKYLQRGTLDSEKMLGNQSRMLSDRKIVPANPVLKTPHQGFISKSENKPPDGSEEVASHKELHNVKIKEMPQTSAQPKLSIRKDLLVENSNQILKPNRSREKESSDLATATTRGAVGPIPKKIITFEKTVGKERVSLRKARGRPAGSRNTPKSDYVYMDADFYYMCEICDSSFLSKAELQEHMFFHRLKSRSRRGEKRSLEESEATPKKSKTGASASKGEAETINVVGFERFKCPKCKGHFANVTDLNRHKTQAHSEDLSADSLEVLKCNYCDKTYRRERELRRHLKHACRNAPRHLKTVLSVGTTLMTLQEKGDGPHYTMVNKSLESLLKDDCAPPVPKGPYKCRYCPLVTRREREMKRHIWKYCPQTPKIIKKRCKGGASLEELGFHCQEEEVEDTLVSRADIPCSSETELEEENGEADGSPGSTAASQASTSGSTSGGKSKEPLVCAYCGIWYYREISLVKHMKERCIIIPPTDKQLLNLGAGLCDTINTAVNPKVLNSAKGFYKRVQGGNLKENLTTPEKKQHPPTEDEDVPGGRRVSNEDLKNSSNMEKIISGSKESTNSQSKDDDVVVPSKPEPAQSKRNAKQKGTRCNRCHETFISAEAVLAHSSVHHGPKKGLYKCKLCHERFQRYKQLREHVWTHTKETPYKCHVCDAKFRLSDSILVHLVSIHNYTEAHERNLYKWLPGRNGKYRTFGTTADNERFDCEESLEGMDTNMENLAEDMLVTDEIWTVEKGISSAAEKASKALRRDGNETEVEKKRDKNKMPDEELVRKDQCSGLNTSDAHIQSPTKSSEGNKRTSLKDGLKLPSSEQIKKENENTVDTKANVKKVGECTKAKNSANNQENLKRRTSSHKLSMDNDLKIINDDDDDDDGELFSGMSNLDSIIETVNLTDDSFI